MPRKLILKNFLSPGDIVMLTAAVRDLHQCYPGDFITDVRTSAAPMWENNPYITPLSESDPDVRVIECHYPLIQQSNQRPYHFIHAFIAYLSEQLNLDIRPTVFRGDIYLSEQEKSWFSQVHEVVGDDRPFWIVASGGKYDFTNKWWDAERYQEVVDCFNGKICFVQVGRLEDNHPALDGVIDLRGKTDLRQLIRLVYHSQGVLCPVTALMHLAAAVPTKPSFPQVRPCVVVAGGREPSHWEAYPNHQFIHTIGALPCCLTGGCWKSRTVPIGDGDEKDRPENLCVNVVKKLPKCMDMITSTEVAQRIKVYFTGGAAQYLEPVFEDKIKLPQALVWNELTKDHKLSLDNAAKIADAVISSIPAYPESFRGRGIVICGGGVKYFTNAWVSISMLRHLGCQLPIQLWYQGPNELDDTMKSLVRKLNVQCIDAEECRTSSPCNRITGWALKPYAIVNCPFKEVLLIDADNVPISDPTFLFDEPRYKNVGAVFWPDYGRLGPGRPVWEVFGVPFYNEPEFESGQVLVNKATCWRALALTLWYNANSHFFYAYIHGDKETFHMAFRKLRQDYILIPHRIVSLSGTMCQHDFEGKRIFQHRNLAKWVFEGENRCIAGFQKEEECLQFLEILRRDWSGVIAERRYCQPNDPIATILTNNTYILKADGGVSCEITFQNDGSISGNSGRDERRWDLRKESDATVCLQLYSQTGLSGELATSSDGSWRSRWMSFGQSPLQLTLTCKPQLRGGTTDEAIWKAVYEQNSYGLPDQLPPEDVIVDIGAHVGAFSCACIARGAKYLYAYEPDDKNFELAERNMQKWYFVHNPLMAHSPICLNKIAIYPTGSPYAICVGPYSRSEHPNGPWRTHECATLFCNEYDTPAQRIDLDLILDELPRVALLKLHCEGAEWPILYNSVRLDRVERILVQLHSIIIKHETAKQSIPLAAGEELFKFKVQSLVSHLAERGFALDGELTAELLSSGSFSTNRGGNAELGLLRFRKIRPQSGTWNW